MHAHYSLITPPLDRKRQYLASCLRAGGDGLAGTAATVLEVSGVGVGVVGEIASHVGAPYKHVRLDERHYVRLLEGRLRDLGVDVDKEFRSSQPKTKKRMREKTNADGQL